METIIKETASLIGSIGMYARLIIVGVWFPGFLIFSECGSVYFRLYGRAQQGLFGYLNERISQFDSPVVTTFMVVFVLASSIAAGYVARDVAFALSDSWLRRQWRPTRSLPDIYAQIRHVYGRDRVDAVAAKYDVFRLATGGVDTASLPRMPETYVREFCKQWLRVKVPSLNTEGLEIEINMVMGLVVPVALSAVVFLIFLKGWLAVTMALVSLAAAAMLLYRINWARNIETEQVIVNFLFAHWEGLPEAAMPPRPRKEVPGSPTPQST